MTEVEQPAPRRRTNRVPRSRGAVSGVLLVLLGIWGGLVPFVGPYFDYSYGSNKTWDWTTGRGWLEVLPGAVAVVGGLLLVTSKNRIRGSLGGWLAALAGAWFLIGKTVAGWWRTGGVGEPVSQHVSGRAAADLGYFYGLGAVIVFLAAFALGRLAVVGVRDIAAAERDDALAAEEAEREREIVRQREEQWEQARQAEAERLEAERAQAERNQQVADEHANEHANATKPVAAATEAKAPSNRTVLDPAEAESAELIDPDAFTSSAEPAGSEPVPDRPSLDSPTYDQLSRRAADDGPSYDSHSDYNLRRTDDRSTATGYDEPAGAHRSSRSDPPEER